MTRQMNRDLLILLAVAAAGGCKDQPPEACEGALAVDGASLTYACGDAVSLSMDAEVMGEGDLSVAMELDGASVTPVVTAGAGGGALSAVALSGAMSLAGEEAPRIWKQGYQSWWWSGVTDLEPLEIGGDGLPVAGGDGDGVSAVDETPATSWWSGLAGRPGGASLLLGALSSTRTKFYAAFEADAAWAVWGGRGESIALAEGESIALDPLWIGGDDGVEGPFALHRSYAQAALDHGDLEPARGEPPTGWATWYQFYSEVTEEEVRENLEIAASLEADGLAPIEVFQIDDGWQVVWGEWTAGEDFPSGMATLADDIAAAGFTPGLWMAPLYVEVSAPIFAEHDDWWVLDEDGEPISFNNFGSNDYRILDVTHPDAAAWLQGVIADRVAEGWVYLKLDFLFAGAQEGQRYADVTGIEAYQIALSLMREAAGDAWILACGAPMLPSLGFADSYRTGADIAFEFDPDPRLDYLRWQGRSTAARSWQNGLWWWNDPDQIIAREPFTDAQVSGAILNNTISGGVWMLGDDLASLPEDRLAQMMDPSLVALRGQAAEPVDPMRFASGPDFGPVAESALPDDAVPTRWRLEGGAELLLNLGDSTIEVEAPAGEAWFSGAVTEEGDAWTLGPGEGEIWLP